MSRIAATFAALKAAGRKALIPYFTAGDPSVEEIVPLMHAIVGAGADIVELGVPFSDPMADGPVNQRSSERALKHHTSLRQVLEAVAHFREKDARTPVVIMGYANPIEAMGYARFADLAARCGVDGVLVVDYPPEEAQDLSAELRQRGIDSIFLLSPTSDPDRVEQVGRVASGYIYYVSLKGVTGATHLDLAEVGEKIALIRAHSKVPVGVGFGIRDPQTARAVAASSDAVVVGSSIVQEIENSPPDALLANVSGLVRSFRQALDA